MEIVFIDTLYNIQLFSNILVLMCGRVMSYLPKYFMFSLYQVKINSNVFNFVH